MFVRVGSIRAKIERRNAYIIDAYLVGAEKLAVGATLHDKPFTLLLLFLPLTW